MTSKTGQAGLLLWCQKVTKGYKNVEILNFHTSWRSGLGFCAIIHKFRPDLLDFESLDPSQLLQNNDLAFRLAAEKCRIPALLDAEDMIMPKPEQFSVITYLAQMYNVFEKGVSQVNDNSNKLAPHQLQTNQQSTQKPNQQPTPTINTNVVKQNTGTVSKPNCFACGNPLTGNVAEWENHFYHDKCFKCVQCNQALNNGGKILSTIMKLDDKPYCENCGTKVCYVHQKRSSPNLTPSLVRKQKETEDNKQIQNDQNTKNKPTEVKIYEETTTITLPKLTSATSPSNTLMSPRSLNLSQPRQSTGKDQTEPLIQQIKLLESRENNYKSRITELESLQDKIQKDNQLLVDEKKKTEDKFADIERKFQALQKQLYEKENILKDVEKNKSQETRKLEDKLKQSEEKLRQIEGNLEKEIEKRKLEENRYLQSEQKLRVQSTSKEKIQAQYDKLIHTEIELTKKLDETELLLQDKIKQIGQLETIKLKLESQQTNSSSEISEKVKQIEDEEKERDLIWQEQRMIQKEWLNKKKSWEESTRIEKEVIAHDRIELDEKINQIKLLEEETKKSHIKQLRITRELEKKKAIFEEEQAKIRKESEEKEEKFKSETYSITKTLDSERDSLLLEMKEQKEKLIKEFHKKQLRLDAEKEKINNKFFELKQFENELNQREIVIENLQTEWDVAFANLEKEIILQEEQMEERKKSPRKRKSEKTSRKKQGQSVQIKPKQVLEETIDADDHIPAEELATMKERYSTRVSVINFDQYLNKGYEGYLEKYEGISSSWSLFGWSKFWFILTDSRLFFYKNKPDSKVVPEGIISIHLATVVEIDNNRDDTIVITFPESTFSLRAASSSDRNEWLTAIVEAKNISDKLQKYTQEDSQAGSSGISRLVKKSDLRKEGYVDVSYFFGWSKMYFVLVDGMLLVFNSKGGSRKHKIPLYGSTFMPEPTEKGQMTTFVINSPEATKKELKCSCQSEEETQHWLTVLLKQKLLIEEAINGLKFD